MTVQPIVQSMVVDEIYLHITNTRQLCDSIANAHPEAVHDYDRRRQNRNRSRKFSCQHVEIT